MGLDQDSVIHASGPDPVEIFLMGPDPGSGSSLRCSDPEVPPRLRFSCLRLGRSLRLASQTVAMA